MTTMLPRDSSCTVAIEKEEGPCPGGRKKKTRFHVTASFIQHSSAASPQHFHRPTNTNHATRRSAPQLSSLSRARLDIRRRHRLRPVQSRSQPKEQETRRSTSLRPARRKRALSTAANSDRTENSGTREGQRSKAKHRDTWKGRYVQTSWAGAIGGKLMSIYRCTQDAEHTTHLELPAPSQALARRRRSTTRTTTTTSSPPTRPHHTSTNTHNTPHTRRRVPPLHRQRHAAATTTRRPRSPAVRATALICRKPCCAAAWWRSAAETVLR